MASSAWLAGVPASHGTHIRNLPIAWDAMPHHFALACGSPGWHIHDLQRAASSLSITTELVSLPQLSSSNDLLAYDAVLLRTFPSGSLEQTIFRLALLYQAERAGQVVINSPAAFEACVDKYSTTARLAHVQLPVPRTICCQTLETAMAAYQTLGGDVVIKPIFGSEGKGLVRASEEGIAWRLCSMLCQQGAVVYLQEFIPHSGYDVRVLVLDGRVLAAMRRRHPTDWRTNLARGAIGEPVQLSDRDVWLALQAATTVGANFAGVDLLHRPSGETVILEVNGVPGWQGISQVTKIDVADRFLRYALERCQRKGLVK